MVNIIVKSYEHFNKSLPNWHSPQGRYISSKRQYVEECKRAGLVPFEQAEATRKDTPKLKPSKECIEIVNYAKSITGKKGKVKLPDRAINKMISMGAIKNRDIFADKLPKVYQERGGFNNAVN